MTNQQLHELLPWYMTGTLASKEKDDFDAHLADCATCRAELEFLEGAKRQIVEHGDALLTGHPSTDTLVGAVLGEITGAEAETVRHHLALCPDCALESSWARDEAIAGGANPKPAATVARANALAHPLWGWAVAAAAMIALVVLIPRGGGPEPRIGIVTPVLVTETVRGAESGSAIEIDRGRRQNPMFVVDLPPDAYPVTITITNDTGTLVYSEHGIPEDSTLDGVLQIEYVGLLPIGDYAVRVASETADELPSEFRIRLVGN